MLCKKNNSDQGKYYVRPVLHITQMRKVCVWGENSGVGHFTLYKRDFLKSVFLFLGSGWNFHLDQIGPEILEGVFFFFFFNFPWA